MRRILSLLCATAFIAVGAAGVQAKDEQRSSRHTDEVPYVPSFTKDQLIEKAMGEGYANISNIYQEGYFYTADATKNGQTVHLVIDARDGQIRESG